MKSSGRGTIIIPEGRAEIAFATRDWLEVRCREGGASSQQIRARGTNQGEKEFS